MKSKHKKKLKSLKKAKKMCENLRLIKGEREVLIKIKSLEEKN